MIYFMHKLSANWRLVPSCTSPKLFDNLIFCWTENEIAYAKWTPRFRRFVLYNNSSTTRICCDDNLYLNIIYSIYCNYASLDHNICFYVFLTSSPHLSPPSLHLLNLILLYLLIFDAAPPPWQSSSILYPITSFPSKEFSRFDDYLTSSYWSLRAFRQWKNQLLLYLLPDPQKGKKKQNKAS